MKQIHDQNILFIVVITIIMRMHIVFIVLCYRRIIVIMNY